MPTLITFLLSLTVDSKNQSIDAKSGEFFQQARRSGLWPEAEAAHRSAVTRARAKLPWTVFETLLADAVNLAYSVWPESDEYTWHGMTAVAFDGSKYTLPGSPELREAFDPESGLEYPGKGHYPQCLISTAFDVLRRLPLARAVSPITEGNEREDVLALLPKLPERPMVLLFDRGYPGYDLIGNLHQTTEHHYVFRCPAKSTFKAVEQFVQSGKPEAALWLDRSSRLSKKRPDSGTKTAIMLRAIRLESPDGTLSVLLTNLLDHAQYPAASIVELYFRRWRIEEQYRDEKTHLGIENFHSQSENGIRQELFAVLVMCVISRTLMALMSEQDKPHTPQFKNAIRAVAADAALLTATNPELALRLFRELLNEIARVKYYKPKSPRKPYPRVSRKPVNKWQQNKVKRMAA